MPREGEGAPSDEFLVEIRNQRVHEYYARNPHVDVEAVNLVVLDLFEALGRDLTASLANATLGELAQSVRDIKADVGRLGADVVSSVYVRFQDSKREYLDEMRSLVHVSLAENREKVQALLQQSTAQLVDKTSLLLGEMLPRAGEGGKEVRESLERFRAAIGEETAALARAEAAGRVETLRGFAERVETGHGQMMQTIFGYVNATEERLGQSVRALRDEADAAEQKRVLAELAEYLGKCRNSSYKGQFGENRLEGVLCATWPTADVANTTAQRACGDFRLSRAGHADVLVETKDYERNVSAEEVQKFQRDCEEQGLSGVFLSQSSGIASKQNFHIDVRDGRVLVYAHCVGYDRATVKLAVDVVDALGARLAEHVDAAGALELAVSRDELDDVGREYNEQARRLAEHEATLRDFHRRATEQVARMASPLLGRMLAAKLGDAYKAAGKIRCDICNAFDAKNMKALAAHKRGCVKPKPA